jgi:Mrp family chromosome partitioning ATPase
MLSDEKVHEALGSVQDPELGRNLVDLGMVRKVAVHEDRVDITLALTTLACPFKERISREAERAVMSLGGVSHVIVEFEPMLPEQKERLRREGTRPGTETRLNDVRHVVSVMSGKGGVGKSLVSALLAVALRREGHIVGLLDADITGPSIPKMFFSGRPPMEASPMALVPPATASGIRVMSINLLLEREDQPVIWRGPLVGRAIQQLWNDVLWGDLDYMIVDLPPGTSDAPLTVMQSLPQSGVVLVTTPQDLAGMVVKKAAHMAFNLGVPILGLVENMSYFVCPDTGKHYEIFGPSHAEEIAQSLGIPLLGRLPLDPEIARLCDQGRIEAYEPLAFQSLAHRIAAAAAPARPPRFPMPEPQARQPQEAST